MRTSVLGGGYCDENNGPFPSGTSGPRMYDDYELVYGFDLCFRSYLFYRHSNIYLVYPIWNSAKAFRFI